MKELIHFEIKKIMDRKANQIAMILGILLIIFCNVKLIQDESLTINDTELKGVTAIHTHEDNENSLTEWLDERFLTNFLKEYQQKAAGNPYNYDYSLIAPVNNLYSCIAKNYVEWNEYMNWEKLMTINTEGGIGFYERRIEKIETLLNAEYSYGNYSEAEKDYWMEKAKSIDTPFKWGSKETWNMIWNGIGIMFYLFFVLIICIAPVFSGESQNKTDALLLTTKHGKSKAIYAKIIVSFLFSFFYIALCSIIGIGINIALLGTNGWNLPVQLWDTIIPYQWTALEACGMNLLIIFLCSFMLISFTMLLSILNKSPMIVLAVDVLLFFGTIFLPFSKSSRLWNKILYLLPLNTVNLKNVLTSYNSYQFGNIIVSYLGMIIITNIILTILFLLFIRIKLQKYQIRN